MSRATRRRCVVPRQRRLACANHQDINFDCWLADGSSEIAAPTINGQSKRLKVTRDGICFRRITCGSFGPSRTNRASFWFRGAFFHKGPDGTPLTCEEVNAKKPVGGYAGFTGFVSGGHPENT